MCLMVEIVCQEYDVVLTTFVATHYQPMIPVALYYDLPFRLIGLLAFKDYTKQFHSKFLDLLYS